MNQSHRSRTLRSHLDAKFQQATAFSYPKSAEDNDSLGYEILRESKEDASGLGQSRTCVAQRDFEIHWKSVKLGVGCRQLFWRRQRIAQMGLPRNGRSHGVATGMFPLFGARWRDGAALVLSSVARHPHSSKHNTTIFNYTQCLISKSTN